MNLIPCDLQRDERRADEHGHGRERMKNESMAVASGPGRGLWSQPLPSRTGVAAQPSQTQWRHADRVAARGRPLVGRV